MAEPAQPLNKRTPRSSYFLACFGFSVNKKLPEKTIQISTRKNSPLLPCPMFRLSVSKSRTKTVPVDNSEKAEADSKTPTSKLIKKKSNTKLSSVPQTPTTNNRKPLRQNSKADPQPDSSNQSATARERPKEGPEQNIILSNRKFLDLRRTGSNLPGSPKPKTQTKLSHTVSLPVLERNQRERVGNPRIHARNRINSKELQSQKKNNGVVEKLDPVMGMSIILVTLIIMLVWGRLCAILCTSAWFYFCPRFRTTVNDNIISVKSSANTDDLDLNSEEYTKKVVLEGLLERNHRVTL
ncbi:hypothetical protein PTKIN_Ptkin02bG0133700 [Pterospermum kingtungense]